MNKRERNSRTRGIVKDIVEYLKVFGEKTKPLMKGIDLVDETTNFLASELTIPDCWEGSEIKMQLLSDFIEYDEDAQNIIEEIKTLYSEVDEQVYDMSDNSPYKTEWEDFLGGIEELEDVLNVEENEYTTVKELYDAFVEVKYKLIDLI